MDHLTDVTAWLKTDYWVLIYCRHILFGRKVLHKVGSHFRPPLPPLSGLIWDAHSRSCCSAWHWIPGITMSTLYLESADFPMLVSTFSLTRVTKTKPLHSVHSSLHQLKLALMSRREFLLSSPLTKIYRRPLSSNF